jgi:hypothetical protein
MAWGTRAVTVAATGTLLWQCTTVTANISPSTGVYRAGSPTDQTPILITVPTGSTLHIVSGSGASPVTGDPGIVGPAQISYNNVGDDSMYGAITGGGTVGVSVGRQ